MDPLILCGAIVAAQQSISAASLIFNNITTQHLSYAAYESPEMHFSEYY
jgi:hypothetical protein